MKSLLQGYSSLISPGSHNVSFSLAKVPHQPYRKFVFTYKFTDDSIRSIGSNDGRHPTNMQCQSVMFKDTSSNPRAQNDFM